MMLYEEIFRAFQKQRVRYVIVGGIAVNLLGSLRSTADLDILVEMSDRNLMMIVGILKRLGYAVKQPVDPMAIADREIREDWIKNKHMKALNFHKDDLQEIDIIVDSPISYEEARKDHVRIKAGNIMLPVLSIDKLIVMKRRAGRAIDNLDIRELRRIKKIRGRQ